MSEELSIGSFQPHVGTRFRLRASAGEPAEIDLELEDVLATGARTLGRREQPFALIFRGPAAVPLPQGTHHLEHDVLGALDIFIVPVGPGDDDQPRYEAIFT